MAFLGRDAKPFEKQYGGTHYTVMRMQPFEFTMINRWDAAAHTTLKYVARHRNKNGLADLQKAGHCVEIRAALLPRMRTAFTQPIVIPMAAFIDLNLIGPRDAKVLYDLETWVLSGESTHTIVDDILNGIVGLMTEYST